MDINKIYKRKSEDTLSNDICLRAKVDTGKRCNYNCNFCYYKDSLNDPVRPLDEIKEEILNLKKAGIKEFDLSGGESSIHPDILEIIEFASEHSWNGKVSMLSNGCFNKNTLIKMKMAGLNEVMFSLHGWDETSHISIVGHRNAYYALLDIMKHCGDLDIKVRINCTIGDNFNTLLWTNNISSYLRYISQINFLPINYWGDASKLNTIDYEKISNDIKLMIDILKSDTKNIEINVRYIPLCFMKNYEKYCVGTYQHIFDKGDWNIQVYDNAIGETVSKEGMFETAFRNRTNTYFKPTSCRLCKYVYVCDGIEKKLEKSNNVLIPIDDKDVVTDVLETRKSRNKE